MDKAERTPTEELRLKIYNPVLERNSIVSRSDFEYLKSVVAETEEKTAHLKENFEKRSRLYDIYSEITKTYYEISRGDYISRIVEEKQNAMQAEQNKSNKYSKL